MKSEINKQKHSSGQLTSIVRDRSHPRFSHDHSLTNNNFSSILSSRNGNSNNDNSLKEYTSLIRTFNSNSNNNFNNILTSQSKQQDRPSTMATTEYVNYPKQSSSNSGKCQKEVRFMIDSHIYNKANNLNENHDNDEINDILSCSVDINAEKVSLDDFEFELLLGKGTYCTVFRTKFKPNQKNYALKKLDKVYIQKNKKQKNLIKEKKLLLSLNHQNIIRLYQTFQDENYVYFMYEFMTKGTLARMIRKFKNQFPLNLARFYAAEIINALEYLRSKEIVHRDLQPLNILIDKDYHLKICDFGDAQKQDEMQSLNIERLSSNFSFCQNQVNFVGSINYASPESLEDTTQTYSTDLWSLGVIIYEMITGELPFKSEQVWDNIQQILNVDYRFPIGLDPQAQDLIKQLLIKDPTRRIGSGQKGSKNDMRALKEHPFFSGLDFRKLGETIPPIKQRQSDDNLFTTEETITCTITEQSHPSNVFEDGDQSIKLRNMRGEKRLQTSAKDKSVDKLLPTNKQGKYFSPQSIRKENRENILNLKEIKRGQLKKKNRFFINQNRIFVLTNEPRLRYYKTEREFRGEIPLTHEVSAELLKEGTFKLNTPRKVFIMKEIEPGDAYDWVNQINHAVQKYGKNLKL
eukprot:403369877